MDFQFQVYEQEDSRKPLFPKVVGKQLQLDAFLWYLAILLAQLNRLIATSNERPKERE